MGKTWNGMAVFQVLKQHCRKSAWFLYCSSGTVAMEFKRKIQVLWNTDCCESLPGKILWFEYFQSIVRVCKCIQERVWCILPRAVPLRPLPLWLMVSFILVASRSWCLHSLFPIHLPLATSWSWDGLRSELGWSSSYLFFFQNNTH